MPRSRRTAAPALAAFLAAALLPAASADAWDELERLAAPVRPPAAQLRWLTIPWVTDPAEALKQARAENRPVFMWAAQDRGRGGVPLERC